eukprot:scaffold238811_cov31-Tisochrysis_lutea.AAC.1
MKQTWQIEGDVMQRRRGSALGLPRFIVHLAICASVGVVRCITMNFSKLTHTPVDAASEMIATSFVPFMKNFASLTFRLSISPESGLARGAHAQRSRLK